jgi:RimJ/RimL family protein N-acetyltransferase
LSVLLTGPFPFIERATGRWVGRVGPLDVEGWPGTEVGWAIVPAAQGRGYAYEAAVASMDFVVDRLGWTDIIHTIHPDNVISQKLAAKLGSVNTGAGKLPPPNEAHPIEIWRQSAAAWRARRV